MSRRIMKNNPAFLERDELIRGFVVRQTDLKLLTERLRQQYEGPSQHILVIAPRGMGKTTLVLRVAFEVQLDKALDQQWYPLVFSEESYEVATAAELWLEALGHLGRQTQDPRWLKAYRDLKNERDEQRLYDRALARLMDFADEQKKKLLVVIENLNMILSEQLSDGDAWKLRHTLQNEPRIMMLATATSRFDEIDNVDKAMYDLFFSFKLEPLDTNECRTMWQSLTGHELAGDRIRPLEILTGGSPRLLAILGSFASDVSLRELMQNLAGLIDEHTSYFKSNLESLPPAERKVYVTLADIWSPATASEVAKEARLDVNKASASLHRLMGRGAVAEISKEGRTIRYQVTERLYNIYHLMRKNVGHESRVRWLVKYMIDMYKHDDIVNVVRSIADEACSTEPVVRRDHYLVYGSLLKYLGDDARVKKILASTNPQFFQMEDAPDHIKELPKKLADDTAAMPEQDTNEVEIERLVAIAIASRLEGRFGEAETAARSALQQDPDCWLALLILMIVVALQGRPEEAEILFEKLQSADLPDILREYAEAVYWAAQGESARARPIYERVLNQDPENHALHFEYGYVCSQLGDFVAAESAYLWAVTGDGNNGEIWLQLAAVKAMLGKVVESESAVRQALQCGVDDHRAWRILAACLLEQDQSTDECEAALRRSLSTNPKNNAEVLPWFFRWQWNGIKTIAATRSAAMRYDQYDTDGHVFLANLALCVVARGWVSLLPMAESWARRAVERDPSTPYFLVILALVLAIRGSLLEAFENVKRALTNESDLPHLLPIIRVFFLTVAGLGRTAESLAILSASPAAKELEPLVVALQILNGQTPNAPYEVLEVAKDIVKQVETNRAKVIDSTKKANIKKSAPKRKSKN